jgi:hypothetical protein
MKPANIVVFALLVPLAALLLFATGCDGLFLDRVQELTSAKTIVTFTIVTPHATGTVSGTSVSVTVPHGTSLASLVASFTITGREMKVGSVQQVNAATANNFNTPVVYTVVAADGSTRDYTVTVTPAPATSKDITAFTILSPAATGLISGTDIAVTVPYGTDVTSLVADFTTTGASVNVGAVTQTSGSTANDFTGQVTYAVTAEDGSTKSYVVTVAVAAASSKDFTDFRFGPAAVGTISSGAITVTVPYGTDVSSLVASFTITGVSVRVGTTQQYSKVTANDFTAPVIYTVLAEDNSTQSYTVTVTIAPNPAKDITAYGFTAPPVSATIVDTAIYVTVPYGTPLAGLVATFTTTGASVKVGSIQQVSGVTANNFSAPVLYTVTAADGTTRSYSVMVTVALNPAKDIVMYGIKTPYVPGIIGANAIGVNVPFGTDPRALVANFAITGAYVTVAGVTQQAGMTPNNFTCPVTYRVHAADGTTKDYIVTVAVTPLTFTTFGASSGLGGLVVNGIASSGSTIYAATTGGLYLSNNGGLSWMVNNNLPPSGVNCVALSGTTICVGTSNGVFVSTNGGLTWVTHYQGTAFISVAVNGTVILAGTSGIGLRYSNGGSWNQGLTGQPVPAVAISGSTLYAATSTGLSVSTTGGVSWAPIPLSGPVNAVEAYGTALYVGTPNGLMCSTNGGMSWTTWTTLNGLGSNYVKDVLVAGSTIYAATTGGLSISTNNGGWWTNCTMANGLGANDIDAVAVDSRIWVGTNGGGVSVSN